jgi:alkanesulfonate monooxygenase SsuD/methylene tetrahydromethanopterin reductase-like flavin-dependent oxidoreductase (luciferase family)
VELPGRQPGSGAICRYARAEEFVEVVSRLWESWDADAVVGDQEK